MSSVSLASHSPPLTLREAWAGALHRDIPTLGTLGQGWESVCTLDQVVLEGCVLPHPCFEKGVFRHQPGCDIHVRVCACALVCGGSSVAGINILAG